MTARLKPILGRCRFGQVTTALLLVVAFAGDARPDNPNPYEKEDKSWITISGVVETVRRDSFDLDFGDGVITVEMDDGDRDADAYRLLTGYRVTVTGVIDDDFFESTTIEAGSVYVADLGTTFFSSAYDDEDLDALSFANPERETNAAATIRGTVTAVANKAFLIDTGSRRVRIDTSGLSYDPLDDSGYQQIGLGDKVKVSGRMNTSFMQGRSLRADVVVKLHDYPAPLENTGGA